MTQMSRRNLSPEEARAWTREVLDTVCRELAVAADELNDQQRRAAHFAPSFVFVDHHLHEFPRFPIPVVTFDKAIEQPLVQFRQAYDSDMPASPSNMADCTLGTSLRVCHCSGERWFPKRLLFGRGIRWGSGSVYQPDNKGDLAITWVTIMVWEDGSPAFIASPAAALQDTLFPTPAPSWQPIRYSGDLAGWRKLLYETGFAPLVRQR
ncbi:hypothetical protein ACQPZP_04640 [Spirillospora sp. CA-142024]|uniref:hypothetical protein n=1 Tax=Spirillospora sp. CA-142024 TaxID=3240036 RepID=UPI003D8E00AA